MLCVWGVGASLVLGSGLLDLLVGLFGVLEMCNCLIVLLLYVSLPLELSFVGIAGDCDLLLPWLFAACLGFGCLVGVVFGVGVVCGLGFVCL